MSRSEGSATVWALIVVALLWLVAGVVTCLTVTVGVRHRAAAAADAAALAGALDGDLTPRSARAAAAAMADLDDAVVLRCAVSDAVVTVMTEVPAPPWMKWAGAARAVARAGPADTSAIPSGGSTPDPGQ